MVLRVDEKGYSKVGTDEPVSEDAPEFSYDAVAFLESPHGMNGTDY